MTQFLVVYIADDFEDEVSVMEIFSSLEQARSFLQDVFNSLDFELFDEFDNPTLDQLTGTDLNGVVHKWTIRRL